MGTSQQAKRDTRERLIDVAAHAFRSEGLDALSVPALSRKAGITHGGFYRHFESREDLAVVALEKAFDDARHDLFDELDTRPGRAMLAEYIDTYTSPQHRESPDRGCVVASLSTDVGRAGGAVRDVFERRFQIYLEELRALLNDPDQDRAAALLCLLAGSVIVARALGDSDTSAEVLRAARRAAQELATDTSTTPIG